ncbi:nucleotidyltransferase domain-containing protein [Pelagibacterium sp.]|uniref:nucleotidyltransferase domain-containing protein n=1 Tax=Pelagibacterium sp. TaxID=1967288 RepID=UPI003BAC4CF0
MAIPEDQLDTWSKQGSVTQSKNTYATIKGALEDPASAYYQRTFSVFLQGSYGNDTNIYADSDVDVVLRLDSTFNYSLGNLQEPSISSFQAAYPNIAYGYTEFKKEVVAWLTSKFGAAVHPGKKAIRIDGNGNRRDADVLPCVTHREYYKFNSINDQSYHEGICFFLPDGTKVVNYPKQHSANLTTKHQSTHGMLKPSVRILKNMRNRMIDDGVIEDGLAPSYFLEGMLSNVPNGYFNNLSYQQTIAQALAWVAKSNHDELVCANGIHYLRRRGYVECWDTDKFEEYLDKVLDYWNNW